jgi:TIR domain
MSKAIFLSYARGDDEAFVARLHADLTERGFDVWWDRRSMAVSLK